MKPKRKTAIERDRTVAPRDGDGQSASRGEFATAIIHLYRGEVGKAVAWRRRLDTTTNWAVITTAAAITFALGGLESARHIVIPLVSILVTFFLLLEARRYRHYDIWQTRVHLMESEFFASMLDPDGPSPHPDWREVLASDLRRPKYHISFAEALGWRLRRNYVWLYLIHLLTWLVKIAIHPFPIISLEHFFERATVGPLPGWFVVLLGVVFNGALIVLGLLTSRFRTAHGEIVRPHDRIRKAAPTIDKRRLPFEEI